MSLDGRYGHIDYLKRLILCFFRSRLDIDIEDVKKLTWNDQKSLIDKTLKNPLLKTYPINNEFARLFFKKIIKILEETSEIHDDLYTCFCSVMSNVDNANKNFWYNHYVVDNDINCVITMKETKKLVVNGTTGMRTWEGAKFLADWILTNNDLFNEKCVLELGSGIGFTGITITKYCKIKSVYLTDCHQDVLDTICENIEINFPLCTKILDEDSVCYKCNDISAGVIKFDWNDFKKLLPNNVIPDVVIGADIVYDPCVLPALCNAIEKLYKINNNIDIYIANVIRNDDTYKLFLSTLDELGYSHQYIEFKYPIHLDWDVNTAISLLRINKK